MTIFDIVLNALATGFGVAIGSYLANKHFIEKFEKLVERLRKVKE